MFVSLDLHSGGHIYAAGKAFVIFMEGICEGALCFADEHQKLAAWTDSSCQELFLDEPCPLPPAPGPAVSAGGAL